jgi:hypothetical protein
MDNWDRKFKHATSLLPIIKSDSQASSTAIKYCNKSKGEFKLLVNDLLDELKVAQWPFSEIEKRWRLLDPLLAESDRIHPPTPIIVKNNITVERDGAALPNMQNAKMHNDKIHNDTGEHLKSQQEVMEAQDAALFSLGDNVRKLKEMGQLISQESKSQSELLSNLSSQANSLNQKTDASLNKVKRL